MRKLELKKEQKQTTTPSTENVLPLKFKITNLKNQIYPNPLTETDYHKLEVGDMVTVGYNSSNIYEITSIMRDTVDHTTMGMWKKKLTTGYLRDKKMSDLLEQYEKCGNFGVNRIQLKVILRGDKAPVRMTYKSLLEPETIRAVNYKLMLEKVELDDIINNRTSIVNYENHRINKLIIKRDAAQKRLDAVRSLKDSIDRAKNSVQVDLSQESPLTQELVHVMEESFANKLAEAATTITRELNLEEIVKEMYSGTKE